MTISKTLRIAAAQTPEFVENMDAALKWLVSAAIQAEVEGAALLCLSEGLPTRVTNRRVFGPAPRY